MSNLFPAALAFLLTALSPLASAHAQQDAIDAFARFVVERSRANEPTIPYPATARPHDRPVHACSLERPLCVHASARVAPSEVEATLAAVERAYDWVAFTGWPLASSDDGGGGGYELDVYLERELPELARADIDGAAEGSTLDAASTFARLREGLRGDTLDSCALSAVAEAGLRAQDPGESERSARMVAGFVAFLASGSFGCPDALGHAQASPESGLLADEPSARSAAVLGLAWAALRHDGGSGSFVREVWQLGRQFSDRPGRVRLRPDFWEALDRALSNAGDSLDAFAVELAIARYFAPHGGTRALPAFDTRYAIEPVAVPALAQLPAHVPARALALFGSAYTRLDTRGAGAGSRLDVWLRGELGPRFALCAVRVDAREHEIGRVCTPGRRTPQAFVPVELGPETAAVLLVVTRLPLDLREPFAERDDAYAFRLIVDRAKP